MSVVAGFTVWAFSEALGKQLITYTPQDKGYLMWMKGGYAAVGCTGSDFSEYYHTPCMVKAYFTAAEKSLKDLGVEVKFQYDLRYTDFKGYDVECVKSQNCVVDVAWQWTPTKYDILLLPRGNRSMGHTRTTTDNKATMALNVGRNQVFQAAHLFRHELAHVMGFAAHLYDANDWRYEGCGLTFTVVPYSKSGLPKSCENDTFLGTWLDPSKPCGNRSMNDPMLYASKWTVPAYANYFRQVFNCWVKNQLTPPAPVPPGEPAICKELKEQLKQKGCQSW